MTTVELHQYTKELEDFVQSSLWVTSYFPQYGQQLEQQIQSIVLLVDTLPSYERGLVHQRIIDILGQSMTTLIYCMFYLHEHTWLWGCQTIFQQRMTRSWTNGRDDPYISSLLQYYITEYQNHLPYTNLLQEPEKIEQALCILEGYELDWFHSFQRYLKETSKIEECDQLIWVSICGEIEEEYPGYYYSNLYQQSFSQQGLQEIERFLEKRYPVNMWILNSGIFFPYPGEPREAFGWISVTFSLLLDHYLRYLLQHSFTGTDPHDIVRLHQKILQLDRLFAWRGRIVS